MLLIFYLVLISISLITIAIIVARKLPQLALLDVDSMPKVQAEKKKEAILKRRANKQAELLRVKSIQLFAPVVQISKNAQLSFRQYVGKIRKKILDEEMRKKDEKMSDKEKEVNLLSLYQDGQYALERNELDIAEKKFIEMVKVDPKNKDAYFGLGKVYRKKGEKKEAEESFEFLLQIDPNNDGALMQLAEIASESGDVEKAIGYHERGLLIDDGNANRFVGLAELFLKIGKNEPALEAMRQAVELEPQNPKYLDMLVDISVKCGDKDSASEAFQQLRMANPDNNKLAILKDKINQMPS